MIREKLISPARYAGTMTKEELDTRLSATVRQAKELRIPTVILIEGWGASGKGYMIEKLIRVLDPRGFKVYSIGAPNEAEQRYPVLKRFWEKLPSYGNISIFDRSWYRDVSIARVEDELPRRELNVRFEDIEVLEKQLCDDGYNIVKIFLHIEKDEQKKRFDKLQSSSATKWRVTDDDRRRHKRYDKYYEAFSEMVKVTDTETAPWYVLDAKNKKTTSEAIKHILLEALSAAIEKKQALIADTAAHIKDDGIDYALAESTNTNKIPSDVRINPDIQPLRLPALDEYDLTKVYPPEEYKKKLDELQDELFELHNKLYQKKRPLIIVFEGWDAAGKGGAIKRLTSGLDPRGFEVVPVAAPTKTELSYQYMWRFWNSLPKSGHIGIYDRSWYGRVMVERLEGFAKRREWTRAFDEMNCFERTLVRSGAIVVKFWLHIDDDEQLRRFTERQNNPEKQWKITDEDWRNRDKRLGYHIAVDQMLALTNTSYARWHVIEANDKKYARIKVLQTVIDTVRENL